MTPAPSNPGSADPASRRRLHASLAAALSQLDDAGLAALLAGAEFLGSGIGGTRVLARVEGSPVFVKRVPLSDLERRPEHVRSTANLFGLPPGCHYGIASPAYGAWRELVANEVATGEVLAGRSPCYPLMFHARVLEDEAGPARSRLPAELADIDAEVAQWGGDDGVRRRLEAVAGASATINLFFEYLPTTLGTWLDRQRTAGDGAIDAAIARIERALRTDVPAMNAAGLFHFDAHFENLLIDDERLYFADFGLAVSPDFALADEERRFLEANATHDPVHTITRFVDWLVTAFAAAPDGPTRDAIIERVADGDPTAMVGVRPAAVAVIERYAPVAAVVNEFYRRLHLEDRGATYPTEAVEQAWSRVRADD